MRFLCNVYVKVVMIRLSCNISKYYFNIYAFFVKSGNICLKALQCRILKEK